MQESSQREACEATLPKEEEENNLHSWIGKSQFLLFVEAFDYIKDKATKCLMIQLMGV